MPALVAAAVWLPLRARSPRPGARRRSADPLWRDPMAWSIAALMGLQSMAFFSTISWLPEILADDGISEGYAGTLAGDHAAGAARARVRGARCSPPGAATSSSTCCGDRRSRR